MRILVSVDIRDRAQQVAAEANRWAAPLGATVDLVYVEQYGNASAVVRDPAVRELVEKEWERLRASHEDELVELMSTFPEGCRGVARVMAGTAANTVAELSPDYDAIIVGTHGRTGLGHLVLGSVAERIVRRALCTVVVMRLKEEA